MNTDNRSIILSESSKIIKQLGNRIVLSLYAQIREFEALTRTVGAIAQTLPPSIDAFMTLIPPVLDFQGDLRIAGGGVWPEPYTFSPDLERRSFFWGRDETGTLRYFDNYNSSEKGYHQKSWYVLGRYSKPGQCFWSESYMDPHSHQPMVTCTTPLFKEGQFTGVVTLDLKLEGLQTTVEAWRKKTGGYVFILDHTNTFITFPDLALVKKGGVEQSDPIGEEFMQVAELAEQQPLFGEVAIALQDMNQSLLKQARKLPAYCADRVSRIQTEVQPISEATAELLTAILTNPLGEDETVNFLWKSVEIQTDFLLHESATAFLFQVPHSYWKVVVVKPFSEAAMATYSLVQAEKMSSLGQFVAGLAHEVNNPINFIYGNLKYASVYVEDLLELIRLYQKHSPSSAPEIQQHLEASDFKFMILDLPKILASMKVGADRIRQIVLSLKNFSRLEGADTKVIDLHQSLDNSLLFLESRLKGSRTLPAVKVIKEYGSIPPVECYPGPLNQVFMNLLVNALDALETYSASPLIRIRTQLIQGHPIVGDGLSPSRVLISIADNGPGIPEGIQQKLFDPFFTTKPVGKGTGLGLAICYQIITESHQGQLRCSSVPGQGAEFHIEIPIRQPGPNRSVPREESAPM